MDLNFKERAKKIETKIFLWMKYNLSNIVNLSIRNEISTIIKINVKSKYLLDKLLPLRGGKEIDLDLAEKLCEDSNKNINQSKEHFKDFLISFRN